MLRYGTYQTLGVGLAQTCGEEPAVVCHDSLHFRVVKHGIVHRGDAALQNDIFYTGVLKMLQLTHQCVRAGGGHGCENKVSALNVLQHLPGGHFFAEDALTDQPERVLAGEIIREKLLRLLDKEIPHGVAVVVERMRERENQPDMLDIDAVIYCERDNHKGIIIGKKGSMLKRVGSYAREDMERFFDCKINLQLWVKVKEDWRNRQRILQSLGYGKTDFE